MYRGPEEWKWKALARLDVIAYTYLSPNAPVQLATPTFLEQRHGFQKQVMARVRRNLADLDRQLAAQKTCSRLEVEGGWYAVLRVPATGSDEELAIELLTKEDVYVHPGHFFDFAGEGYLVVRLIMRRFSFRVKVRLPLSNVKSSGRSAKRLMVSHCARLEVSRFTSPSIRPRTQGCVGISSCEAKRIPCSAAFAETVAALGTMTATTNLR